MNNKGVEKGNQVSNEMGEAKFGIDCEQIANFNASRSGYENGTATMEKSQNGAKTIVVNLTANQTNHHRKRSYFTRQFTLNTTNLT